MTTTERWIIAGALLLGGVLIGAIAGWLLRRRLMRSGNEAAPPVAGTAGLLVFWSLTLIGVLLAVAMVRPATLEDLPRRLLDYTPRLIVAGLILVAGYAVARFASRLVGFGMERASGRAGPRVATAVRGAILAATLILALAQLGVETTILVLLAGLAGFGVVLAAALLIGLGGRPLAAEIAAGRYFGRFLEEGAEIRCAAGSGRVVALHPGTLEIESEGDFRRHIPYSALLAEGAEIRPRPAGSEPG